MAGDQKRLGILRDFLRVLPMHDSKGTRRFDMEYWTTGRLKGVGYDALTKCETAGCAYGWATTIPEFRDLGWRMKYIRGLRMGSPMIGEAGIDEAGPSFFGISRSQQRRIVMPSSYNGEWEEITPQMVADRIQEIMDE